MVASGRRLVALFALSSAGLVGACYGTTTDEDPEQPSAGSGGGGGDEAGSAGSGTEGGGDAVGAAGAEPGAGGGLGFPDPPTEAPEAVDLLFVIDNSISMADKQELLVTAVPELVRRLITPNCLDADGTVVGVSDAMGECASGEPEFGAVTNLHLGIITSSIGGHGGQVCGSLTNLMQNDHARMIGSVREGLASWDNTGFLAWDPTGTGSSPPGESDAAVLFADFQDHVLAVGEQGCGYEAPLEAFYRFLIDPEPPADVALEGGVSMPTGIDSTILAQRAAFLRPDSLVGVILLTDENDCSILDEGQGWLVGLQQNNDQPFQMPAATSACAADPNDPCCRSCASNEASGPPAGCGELGADAACLSSPLSAAMDNLNLRCWDQKRRFGFDLLYPVQRYIDGLSELEVPNLAGQMVQNPLFVRQGIVRHPSRVFLAGAVGVPWQDLTDGPSLTGAGLRYLTPGELETQGRWDIILGNPATGVLPTDPLMIESVDPRTGTHPILEVPLAPANSTDPQANPINGHEQVVTKRDDLQYACIFPLATPRDCSLSGADANACDCNAEDLDRNRPLCQPPGGGPADTMQYYAKAYPGIRHLQVLKGLGQRSIVTSVCPKLVDGDVVAPGYGYNPLTFSVVEHAAPILRGEPP